MSPLFVPSVQSATRRKADLFPTKSKTTIQRLAMFSKLGALLDRIGSKRSPTKPSSKPRGRARAFSVSGAPATPPRTSTTAGETSAPSTTLVFPLSPRPDDSLDVRPRVLSPARRVRFSSGSSVCTTHSKDDYDRSPIVDAPAGATHEGTHSPSKLRKERERDWRTGIHEVAIFNDSSCAKATLPGATSGSIFRIW